jgi:hypothetical protein
MAKTKTTHPLYDDNMGKLTTEPLPSRYKQFEKNQRFMETETFNTTKTSKTSTKSKIKINKIPYDNQNAKLSDDYLINSILSEDSTTSPNNNIRNQNNNDYDDSYKLDQLDKLNHSFKQTDPSPESPSQLDMGHIHTELPGYSGFPTNNLTADQMQNLKCYPRPEPDAKGDIHYSYVCSDPDPNNNTTANEPVAKQVSLNN